MAFIYHMVPADLRGTILQPLNTLKESQPDLYTEYSKKYQGREFLMERIIPTLNCLWNSVLHFAPLHPKIVFNELRKLKNIPPALYYEIDASKLEPELTTIFLYKPRKKGTPLSLEDFAAYDPKHVQDFAYLPEETISYFRETIDSGKRPLLFHFVPHILYKGELDTQGLKVIEV